MGFGVFMNLIIGLVIAIAAIIGLAVGLTKQFSRPLVVIGSVLGAIILVMIFYPMLFQTGILDNFVTKATGWFSADYYTRPITDVDSLQEAISNNYLHILSGSADKVFAQMERVLDGAEVMTIGSFFGRAFVNIVIEFSMWLVFYLIIKYFLYGVMYLLGKITQVVVFKSIDRILGAVWSLLWTYIILIGVVLTAGEIVVNQFFPDYVSTLADYIAQSSLLKLAHDTNVLGSFIANLLSMPLIKVS